jgi:hypothetical protein
LLVTEGVPQFELAVGVPHVADTQPPTVLAVKLILLGQFVKLIVGVIAELIVKVVEAVHEPLPIVKV